MLGAVCVGLLAVLVAYMIWKSGETQPARRYRYDSFAPVRNDSRAKWFVDGKDYMSAVAYAIESAKEEILITDWQMNPYIFLKRPDTGVDSLYWRLDKMLLRKADEGVSVYILLWGTKNDLGSNHTQTVLNKHGNIKVLRHPGWVINPEKLRWSHHEKLVIVDRTIAFVGGIDLCFGRWDTPSHELMDDYPIHPCVKEEGECVQGSQDSNARYSRWIGKDYRNTFLNNESKMNWGKPFDDYEGFDRGEVPRMPWHDVACAFTGNAVLDAVKHFTQRYNVLIPSWKLWEFLRQPSEQDNTDHTFLDSSAAYDVNVQVLRSVDNWSAEQPHEASIYNAYLEAIKNAKHFIYIENQFFISSQSGFWREVQNQIQSALVDRIVRAHEASEDFHVMVITPLKPEFPGEWDSVHGEALRFVTKWNSATIANGDDSLVEKLEKRNVPKDDIKKYFSIFGLRTYGLLKGYFMTEIIYVHSKVMIVDDRVAIIGSANINDRSMLGGRDSEVAVIIEDVDMMDGEMNGSHFQVGKFSHNLRCNLLKEHLGMLANGEDVSLIEDPLERSFLKAIEFVSLKNTIIYLYAFGPGLLKSDRIALRKNGRVEDFGKLKRWKKFPIPRKDTNESRKLLEGVIGNTVTYPCTFWLQELLKPSLHDRNLRSNKETFYT